MLMFGDLDCVAVKPVTWVGSWNKMVGPKRLGVSVTKSQPRLVPNLDQSLAPRKTGVSIKNCGKSRARQYLIWVENMESRAKLMLGV